MQFVSADKIVKEETIQVCEEHKSQSLSTQTERGDEIVAMLPEFKKDIL